MILAVIRRYQWLNHLHIYSVVTRILKTVQLSDVEEASDDYFWNINVGKYTVYLDKTKATYFYYDGADIKPTTSSGT